MCVRPQRHTQLALLMCVVVLSDPSCIFDLWVVSRRLFQYSLWSHLFSVSDRVSLDLPIFAFLGDSGNFPDGVTVLMNTQYNPFDDCTASPYPTVTPAKNEIVNAHNAALTARAGARDWAFIADQHGPFLGHEHHFDKPECPNYIDGADNWMNDLIHPDATGHGNLSVVLQSQVDEMYVDCE